MANILVKSETTNRNVMNLKQAKIRSLSRSDNKLQSGYNIVYDLLIINNSEINMDSDEEIKFLVGVIFEDLKCEQEKKDLPLKKNKRKRKMWVRDFYKNREQYGAHCIIVKGLSVSNPQLFRNYLRMTPDVFQKLLEIVGPHITKSNFVRESISASERLSLTLRYLASGDSQKSIAFAFAISPPAVHFIIQETTQAIWNALKNDVFPDLTKSKFEEIANGFSALWNFPNCLGAIDGKHILMQAPANSGSSFYNYKKSHSIVLLAICDANYNFIMCSFGAAGRQSDGGIWRHSKIGQLFSSHQLDIPEPKAISARHTVPHVFVADDAFPLSENLMKPFIGANLNTTQTIFNYRLSRARRTIENSFGILSSMWRIFRKPVIANVNTVEKIVGACVCLHNWLRETQEEFIPHDLVDREGIGAIISGTWRDEESAMLPFEPNTYNSNTAAKNVRLNFADYFQSEGAVAWQTDRI